MRPADNDLTFFIRVIGRCGEVPARKAVIEGFHTNLVLIEKDGRELFPLGRKEQSLLRRRPQYADRGKNSGVCRRRGLG